MDMWEPYIQSTRVHLPAAEAKIVFDKFHVAKHVHTVIQWVKKTARGFRNPEHFKIAIYFHCGGLDLYPHESR